MPFTNDDYWLRFCAWIETQSKHDTQRIISAYIEQNFEHFMQFVENQHWMKETDNSSPQS
jgi:hypothetical protein